jgi:hypothetical protein
VRVSGAKRSHTAQWQHCNAGRKQQVQVEFCWHSNQGKPADTEHIACFSCKLAISCLSCIYLLLHER